jgi:hypothetical protein
MPRPGVDAEQEDDEEPAVALTTTPAISRRLSSKR